MPEQMRPSSEKQAPDPAIHFDRSDPKREAGQRRVDTPEQATPTPSADVLPATVTNAQAGDKQVNAEEAADIAPKPRERHGKKGMLGWKKRKG